MSLEEKKGRGNNEDNRKKGRKYYIIYRVPHFFLCMNFIIMEPQVTVNTFKSR
jgi:hypothetical protein